MKEELLIDQIKLLKTIQPSNATLKTMQESVYEQVNRENRTRTHISLFGNISILKKPYSTAFYGIAAACILIFFLSIPLVFFPNQVHSAFLYGRLAVASNQYQRARIALLDTTSRFDKKQSQINAQELAQSLALANTELNNLKLKGESGQYSAQECHQIYQMYLTFLEREGGNISTNTLSLKSQINSYEEQAEKKLNMYNSL